MAQRPWYCITKKSQKKERKILSYFTPAVWPHFPATIKWIQNERDRLIAENILLGLAERQKGINATIILLSAVCIEGFLVDCLESFVIVSRLATHDTYQKRLDYDFFKRVSVASFGDFPELFRIALGKPLSEIIKDKSLIEGVKILIDFRNGVGHGRAPVYESYDKPDTDEQDFEMGKQYKTIYKYLKEKKLIRGSENIFHDKVTDHFADLVKPYMETVIPLLPPIQSDNVIKYYKYAYHDVLE